MVSKFVKKAVWLAAELHNGQVRKGTKTPYITHPIAVMELVAQAGGSDEEQAAAVLHDVVEDCGGKVALAKVVELCGPHVAAIVLSCSDSMAPVGAKKAPWRYRKEAYLNHLYRSAQGVRLVSVCDKIHNAESILADYAKVGPAVFERFRAGRAGTLWYYRRLVEVFEHVWTPVDLVTRLDAAVTKMEGLK